MLDLFLAHELNVAQSTRDMFADIAFTQRRIRLDEVGKFVRQSALIGNGLVDRFVFMRP